MKTLAAIVLALGVGFAAAYIVVSWQKDAQLEQLKAKPLVAVVAPAPAPEEKIVMVPAPAAPAPVVESPQEILDELLNIKLGADNSRNADLRLVVFKLETLKQRGADAVPAIRAFIGRDVDVNYSQQDVAGSDNGANQIGSVAARGLNRVNIGGLAGMMSRNSTARRARNLQSLQADWVVPPSLRLGLVAVLKQIGGADSEQALAEMLNRTGRGVEIAYLTVALEEIAPGKYQNIAVTAAKELLMNPPAIDNPDNLDQLSKSYLYGVLEFYKDTSFASNASQMLVGADGRLDQDAMDYLSTVLKDQSVSAFYAAYQNPALTNQTDRMLIRSDVLNYIGQNPQANALLAETLDDPDLNPRTKALTLIGLTGGENDPQTVNAKIALFTLLLNKYANDPLLSKAIAAAINNLQNPDQPIPLQEIFGNGLRGGGNNGNENGGGNNF